MKHFLLLALLYSLAPASFAQTPENLLQKVHQEYNAEKIYVHYDKASYTVGETIWFKAYIMNGYLPSTKSTVFGLELINDSGKVVEHRLLPVLGSAAIGEITTSQTLPSGVYRIRAYTRNLMNLGYENFYYHELTLYNPQKSASSDIKERTYILDFFPEGGNMVANIANTVAFKCTDQSGRPASVEGKITDATGKEILSFKSEHDGMGKFQFIPGPGETYMAESVVEGMTKKMKTLPPAVAGGVALTVSHQGTKKFFTIDASSVVAEEKWPAYMLGVQENMVVFKVAAGLKILKGEIPSNQLLTGILQLTVFNKNHQPLAERLVFINSGDYVPEGSLQLDKVDLNPRAKNIFTYKLKDTIPGTFSVSVISADIDKTQTDNIVSRFLLSSDIKGRVFNPAYYFEKNDEQHQQRLDLVMLTNGWRRYSWREMADGRFPNNKTKDPNFISMKAEALNKVTGKPLRNTDITMFTKTKDGRTNLSTVQSDSSGILDLSGMMFEDTANFSFRINAGKKQDVLVKLLTPGIRQEMYSFKTPLPVATSYTFQTKAIPEEQMTGLTRFDGILLDEVKVNSKIKTAAEKFEKERVTGRWGGMANKTIDLLTNPPKFTQRIFDYLRGNVAGVNVSGGPTDYFINYRNSRSLMGGPIAMTIYVDEFEVQPAMIAMMDVSEVAMIKVFGNNAMTGVGGSLAIYTKRGAGIPDMYDVPISEFQIEGFSPTKEFFSPNYSDSTNLDIHTDERTTLYWNPYLVSNPGKNSISFSFHNSDKAKRYKVILQGMLGDGKLLHVEKIFE